MDCRRLLVWAAICCLIALIPASAPAQDKAKTEQPAGATSSQNQAATPAPAPAAKPPDFSKEALVFDKTYTRIRFEDDGTGTRETTGRVHILAEAGVKTMAVLTFTYTASNQQVDVAYVRVIKPDGSVVTTPPYNIQDMPADVSREAPMYSDIHQKHVAVKGLGVGDTLEYQVTLNTFRPEVPGHFWFEYNFAKEHIILDEELDLDVPAGKPVTVASADMQPTITAAGGRKLYHWAGSNLTPPDPDAPPKSKKNWKPTVQVTTFTNWEQVGEWYASLQKDSLAITPAIQARADALTKGLTSDQDKLRAIFNDVALHIHYVGLEFGIGRYQPHPADDVLSNEYGDCKDKHTLLAALLKAAGIEAWPVLISSKRYLDTATPSPRQFDHVITLVPISGKLVWMDSTEEVAPIGVLARTLRDKQALAIPVGKPAYLVGTPADLPSPRTIHIEIQGSLSDQGLFTGKIAETTDGDVGALMRATFRRVPQSQWKELVERIAHAQSFGGEASNPQVSDVEKIDEPFHFEFDYSREKYYKWDDNETLHWIGPPMMPVGGELPPGIKEKKPADDPDLGAAGETLYRSSLKLPDGWTMTPPRNVNVIEDWAEYHSTYSFANGVFTAERRCLIKKATVPLAQWEQYLAFRRSMGSDEDTQVLISPPLPRGRHKN
jgi:transglutaminase-like putative cysteine protease